MDITELLIVALVALLAGIILGMAVNDDSRAADCKQMGQWRTGEKVFTCSVK